MHRKRLLQALKIIKKLKYCPLTGYITKPYFEYVLKDYLEKIIEERGGTIIFFDANNLKKVNDTLGYKAGDLYLKTIADYVLSHAKKEIKERKLKTTLYPIRYGGDEFLIIVPKFFLYNPLKEKDFTYSKSLIQRNQLSKTFGNLEELIKNLGKITLYKKKNNL